MADSLLEHDQADEPRPKTRAKGKAPASTLRREERGERLSVYLPPELVTALRVKCAEERRSLSDALTAAVEAWVKPRCR